MTDKQWNAYIAHVSYDRKEFDKRLAQFRAAVLKEAAERAARYIYDDIDCPMAFEMIQHILGDHATKMTDLDHVVQDAVQKNFMEMAGSNELLKQRGVTYKTTMLEPPDASFECPDCAESVDGQPGNSACQQCKEEEEL
jgi:hypothetical protein